MSRKAKTLTVSLTAFGLLIFLGMWYAHSFRYSGRVGVYRDSTDAVMSIYYAEQESLEEIVSYFSSLYTEGLTCAEIVGGVLEPGSTLVKNYSDRQDEYTDVSGEKFFAVLTGLQEKYGAGKSPELRPFDVVCAYYDEDGHLALDIQARVDRLNGDGVEARDRVYYTLEYVEDGFGKFRLSEEPFADNWYVLSGVGFSG